jgi:peptidoglycan/LPS O-acetylase OafA/YrhL
VGLLRTLLALCVVLSHLHGALQHGPFLIDGSLAVEAFFLISGFYMAMILDGKYKDRRAFYSNRALRLLPTYWAALLATVVLYNVLGSGVHWFDPFAAFWTHPPSVLALVVVAVPVAFGVGLDIALFLAPHGHSVAPTAGSEALASGQPVGQAWTLGVEIWFYLLAPVLTRWRTRTLVALTVVLLAARAVTYAAGGYRGNLTYRLFPFELPMFLLGILAWRVYRSGLVRTIPLAVRAAFVAGPFVGTFAFPSLLKVTPSSTALQVAFYAGVLASIPFLFDATRNSRLDRTVGMLSYPIYMTHLFVIAVLDPSSVPQQWLAIFAVLIVSSLLVAGLEVPVDRFRQRRAARQRASSPAEHAPAHKLAPIG